MKNISHCRNLLIIVVVPTMLFPLFAHTTLDTDLIYSEFSQRFSETPPPPAQVRPIAEFEPSSAVIIRYPLGIPTSLVTHLSNTADVICVVSSTSVQNQATTTFNNAGVNMSRVSFMIAATDSYWTRDFGPWFIIDGNGIYSVLDFQYNRPRPNDNMFPQVFAQQMGYNYYGMNLQQTGGNYMTDGINTAAQTQIAYTENSGQGQAGVNLKMQNYLGITSYHVVQDPNNTYIDHIDCWGKFLAPDKILIRSVPTSHAQYDEIESVASYFANQNCAWGYPYKVYRVYTPQNQPYTNSLILNKKVFVPIMNNSNDAAALAVYRNALPGYEVIGITGQSSTPWESTDALHCRTHEVPDPEMLWIGHNPSFGQVNTEFIDINAEIRAFSNSSLIADSVYVAIRVNQGSWQHQTLTYLANWSYTTSLSGFAPGDTIRYYIHAVDADGK
ncbi:MAG TPA: agmatine deiminase family protein, partial [Candidatus Cloacimonadota bacterium]|nr:agmatine deiminase family protein [Candidatus Cloacimonadota bacterium]